MHRILDRLSGRPYLLLTLTMLMWGGNAVAGRLAVGEVSPMALTGVLWVAPVAVLGVALRYQLVTHRQALLERWPSILLMGTLGLTVFNALFYLAAHHTTAVNLTILQGSMPVFVLVGALLFYGTRIHGWQIIGMAVTLLGALLVATRADPGTLASFSFNVGDLWMLAACCLYAGYTVALRGRPAVPGLVLRGLGRSCTPDLAAARGLRDRDRHGDVAHPAWLAHRALCRPVPLVRVAGLVHPRGGADRAGARRAVREPGADLWRAACGLDPQRAVCSVLRCGPDPGAWRHLAGRTEAGVKAMLPGAGSLVQGQNRSLLSEGSRRIWQRNITRVDL